MSNMKAIILYFMLISAGYAAAQVPNIQVLRSMLQNVRNGISVVDTSVVDTSKHTDMMPCIIDDRHWPDDGALCVVDGVMVKSLAGIDMKDKDAYVYKKLEDSCIVVHDINWKHDSIRISSIPFVVNGLEYSSLIIVKSKRPTCLLTLNDIRHEHTDEGYNDLDVVFVIDGAIIMHDIESIKIEKDYILKVDIIKSSEIESMQKHQDILFIKIYTQREQNIDALIDRFFRLR